MGMQRKSYTFTLSKKTGERFEKKLNKPSPKTIKLRNDFFKDIDNNLQVEKDKNKVLIKY